MRGGGLQRAEQRVGRRVGAGEEHAQPAQEGREEREQRAGAGQQQGQGGGEAGVVGHEGEGQHHPDGVDRALEFDDGFLQRAGGFAGAHAQHRHGDERGQEDGGAGGGEDVELVHRGVGRGLGDDGLHLDDQLVEHRHRELEHQRVQRAVLGEQGLEGLEAPDGDHDGEDQEGRPGLGDLAEGVVLVFAQLGVVLLVEAEDALRFPVLQEHGEADQADQRGGDVRQLGPDVVGGEELGDGEGTAGHDDRRPGFLDATPAVHHGDEPERDDHRQQRQLAAGHLADLERVDAGHLTAHDDGDAHGAEGHRCGVGDEAQAGGVERVEAQAHQQGGGDRHRGAEAGRALQEGAEGEADEQHLQALVIGDRYHRGPDDVELPGLDGDLVEEHRRDDDPRDGPQAVQEAVAGRGQGHLHRHLVEEDGHRQGDGDGDGAGDVPLHAQHREGDEEEDDR